MHEKLYDLFYYSKIEIKNYRLNLNKIILTYL